MRRAIRSISAGPAGVVSRIAAACVVTTVGVTVAFGFARWFEPYDLEEAPWTGTASERRVLWWASTTIDTPQGAVEVGNQFQPGDLVVVVIRRGRWTGHPYVVSAKSKALHDFDAAAVDLRKSIQDSKDLLRSLEQCATDRDCDPGFVCSSSRCCGLRGASCDRHFTCCPGFSCDDGSCSSSQ